MAHLCEISLLNHGLLNFYGLIADHKVACWQPIIIQHLRSLPLIAQSAVEKTATLWSVINPEQFSNSWVRLEKHTQQQDFKKSMLKKLKLVIFKVSYYHSHFQ